MEAIVIVGLFCLVGFCIAICVSVTDNSKIDREEIEKRSKDLTQILRGYRSLYEIELEEDYNNYIVECRKCGFTYYSPIEVKEWKNHYKFIQENKNKLKIR